MPPQRQKWELARVVSRYGVGAEFNHAMIYKIDGSYTSVELKKERSKGDKDDFDAKNRFVAKLLSEGWEPLNGSVAMYGAVDRLEIIYFRRLA